MSNETIHQQQKPNPQTPKIIIGMASCGLGAGARSVWKSVVLELEKQKLEAAILSTGCIGMCAHEVLVDVIFPGRTRVTYGNVKTAMVPQILEEHIGKGEAVKKFGIAQMYLDDKTAIPYEGLPFFDDMEMNKGQKKYILRNCGYIDPDSIEEYIARGGYTALEKVLKTMQTRSARGHHRTFR